VVRVLDFQKCRVVGQRCRASGFGFRFIFKIEASGSRVEYLDKDFGFRVRVSGAIWNLGTGFSGIWDANVRFWG